MNEKDLMQVNEIDMECEAPDDAEFGGPVRIISANATKDGVKIEKNFESFVEPDYSHVNEIDMESDAPDDEEFGAIAIKPSISQEAHINGEDLFQDGPRKTGDILDFGDDEDEILKTIKEAPIESDFEEEHELVGESMKKQDDLISQGDVESDYLKKLQKRHAATNKKGAYNVHFHFAGNPELEKDMFNHDMGTDGCKSNITGTAETSSESAGEAAPAASASVGCSESLDAKYSNLGKDLLDILQVEVIKNSDGSFTLIDDLDEQNDNEASSEEEVKDWLANNFYFTFIAPLEFKTGESFEDWGEWLGWYKENTDPKFKNDMEFIDLWVNHFNEVIE